MIHHLKRQETTRTICLHLYLYPFLYGFNLIDFPSWYLLPVCISSKRYLIVEESTAVNVQYLLNSPTTSKIFLTKSKTSPFPKSPKCHNKKPFHDFPIRSICSTFEHFTQMEMESMKWTTAMAILKINLFVYKISSAFRSLRCCCFRVCF